MDSLVHSFLDHLCCIPTLVYKRLGDPMVSLAFGLTVNPIVANLNSNFNAWYLDDGTLGVELDVVLVI